MALRDQGIEQGVVLDGLVERCVHGEATAWRELHGWMFPKAAAFLQQMGVPPHDIEDACQEVFLQVFRYLPRFQGRSQLSTWLYKVCISQASRTRRRRVINDMLGRLLKQQRQPELDGSRGSDWSGIETQRQMEEALRLMSPRQKLVFVLYELHGLQGDEIARVAGCPAATVRGRLREARTIFSSTLKGEDRQ
jgi:RNA polymerase sigma-70 factor (ECF subfamily)